MTQSKPLWAKVGLLIYCVTGGFLFKLTVGAFASWNQTAYHPLQSPVFWAATIVSGPVMFAMNRHRLDNNYEFKDRLSAATYRLIIALAIVLIVIPLPKQPGSFAEYTLIGCACDALQKFMGPSKPWDVFKEGIKAKIEQGTAQQ